jgi:hypothetical protein
MAYELVSEVLDHTPVDLTPGEQLVMVVIAEYVLSSDYARGVRRTSRPAAEVARRAKMTPSGLRQAFQRLAERGLELRVPLRTGKDNRPVYAMPGRSSTYEIPALAAANGGSCVCDTCVSDITTVEVIHKAPAGRRLNGHPATPKAPPRRRLGASTEAPGASTQSPSPTSENTPKQQVTASTQGASTEAPNRVLESVLPGPRGRTRARTAPASPTNTDLETIIEEIKDHTDARHVTPEHAHHVYRDVLTRAGNPPRHPLAYVLHAIRTEPHRYQPTPTPPPFQPRQLPLLGVAPDPPPEPPKTHWSDTANQTA